MLNDGEIGKMKYRPKFDQKGNVSISFGHKGACCSLFLVCSWFGWGFDSMVAKIAWKSLVLHGELEK